MRRRRRRCHLLAARLLRRVGELELSLVGTFPSGASMPVRQQVTSTLGTPESADQEQVLARARATQSRGGHVMAESSNPHHFRVVSASRQLGRTQLINFTSNPTLMGRLFTASAT